MPLDELNMRNNLRGRLTVFGLEKATSKEAMLANLQAKQQLEWLELRWDPFKVPTSEDISNDDVVLDALQPNQYLQQLQIEWFRGLTIPNWVSSLRNLIVIGLSGCLNCKHLPEFHQLPSLKCLRLHRLFDLEYISETRRIASNPFFPSLKKLFIRKCRNLKGWWRIDGNNDDAELPSFHCLSKLEIRECRNLTSMPLYPSLEELDLRFASLKPLQRTMMLMTCNAAPSTSSNFLAPLSQLKSLILKYCYMFDMLTNEYDKHWNGLASLHSIEFSGLPELVSLPMGLQLLTTLQHLQISGCPKFSERWGSNVNTDVEWAKISHVPNVQIDGCWIQKDGYYQINSEACSPASTVTAGA